MSPDGGRKRVLMVCLGNICRSPTAEAALREAAAEAGLDIEVDSAGTAGWHTGAPPDPRTVAAGLELGLTVTGAARAVRPRDFVEFDLLVAMDRDNRRGLVEIAPDPDAEAKIRLFRDYEPGGEGKDVPDPYYGAEDGFRNVVTMCRAAAHGLVGRLRAGTA